MRELKMMAMLLRASAKSQMIYKADFAIGVIGTVAYNALFLASISIITSQFGAIGGFGAQEIILMYALFEMAHGIYGLILQNMSSYFTNLVLEGKLDVFYTRPYGILTQLNGQRMNYSAFVDLFIGVICFCTVLSAVRIEWNAFLVLMLLLFIISGAFIEFALSMIMNCGAIISPNLKSLYGAYHQLVLISQRYPLSIFSRFIQGLLTCFIPLGFINYYPMMFLMQRPEGWIGLCSPGVAILFVVIAIKMFNYMLKKYSSTGN